MTTIQTLMTRMTDPSVLMGEITDTLRNLDPEFPEEEARFLRAAEALRTESGASAFLAAMERKFISDVIYVGWLGFRWNLECFTNPVSKLLLNGDFEDLHHESRLHTLPMARSAQETVDAFLRALPPERKYLTDGVIDYYAYLQTTVYKLAHYFGFRLADRFLPCVVPGYVSDGVLTDRYIRNLEDFLKVKLAEIME